MCIYSVAIFVASSIHFSLIFSYVIAASYRCNLRYGFFVYILRVLGTSLRGMQLFCLLNPFMTEAVIIQKPVHCLYMITASVMKGLRNSKVNTVQPGRQLRKTRYDKNFRISNFYVCRCLQNSQKNVFVGVSDLYPPTFLKEKTPMQVYSDEFREIFMTPFSRNTSRQLLLFYGVIFTNKIKRAL